MNCKKEKNEPISVYIRVRPLSKQEITLGNTNALHIGEKEIQVKGVSVERYQKSFSFDKVFGPYSKQIEVFKTVAQPAVAEIIAGYNCTIFAYGQTGTGKTYTMAGDDAISHNSEAGIIPRTLAYLFDELRIQNLEYTVRVSYLELYNEEIFDLLSSLEDSTKLKLFDDSSKKGSVVVQGLTEISVTNVNEVYSLLSKGSEKRRTATTLINAQSSRSHTIFCVTVHTKETNSIGEDLLKTGKLNLVDLAGSENVSKSGVFDKRVREACNINQSLLTLGRCIIALTEHRSHIPYRESKLTRLLKDSLGGRTKTSLVATLSPAYCNLDETFNTLDYASRAKHITNKPEINQCLSKRALLKEYGDEIQRLRKDLQATRLCNGIYLDKENYEDMLKELEIQKEEINEKISLIRVMTEERACIEKLCNELQFTIKEKDGEIERKNEQIRILDDKIEDISLQLNCLKMENDAKEFVIDKRVEAENTLFNTAENLLNVTNIISSDTEKLHNKLNLIDEITSNNKIACRKYIDDFKIKINQLQCKINTLNQIHENFYTTMNKQICDVDLQNDEIFNIINDISGNLPYIGNILSSCQEKENEFENEFKTFINDCKENLLTFIKENKLDLDILTKDHFLMFINNLFIMIDQQHEKTETSLKLMKDLIIMNQKMNTTAISDLKLKISNVKHSFYNKLDDIQENISRICHMNVKNILQEQKLENEIEEQTKIILQATNTMKNLIYNKSNMNKIKSKNIIDCCSNVTNIIDNTHLNINSFNEEFVQDTIDIIDDTNNANENIQKNIDDDIEQLSSIKSNIHNVKENFNSSFITNLESIRNKTEHQLNEVILQVDTFSNIFLKENQDNWLYINDIKNAISTHYDQQVLSTEHIYLTYDTFNKILKSKLNFNKIINDKHNNDITVELNELCTGVNVLFNLKEYQRSCNTPKRINYNYPKSIPVSKSNESILEQFYKIKDSQNNDDKENIKNNNSVNVDNNLPDNGHEKGKILHLKNVDSYC